MGTLNIDRYHAAMGDASFKDVTRLHNGQRLSDAEATFYVTQRKLPFAPCLGHERLVRLLVDSQIDRPRLRFLEQDRGGLQLFAKAIEDIQFVGKIRTVRAGTIVFVTGRASSGSPGPERRRLPDRRAAPLRRRHAAGPQIHRR